MGLPVIDSPLAPPQTGAIVNCTAAAQLSAVTTEAYLWVANLGATTLTVGGSAVTAGAGIGIPAGVVASWRVLNPSQWYGVGSASVQVATTAAS
jgi:hypothetical protein